MSDQNPNAAVLPGDVHVGYERRWAAMFVLLAAWFMNLLDVSIVNVALPSIQNNLRASERGIQWVVEVYILTYALGLLPLGRLGDIVGRRGMFIAGVVAFTGSSAFCGVASGAEMLIAARALQGLGAAMMSPQVMAIAQAMFPPKERASAFALFGLTSGLAAILGPLASGILIHANLYALGWRWVFLINIPVGLVTVVAATSMVPKYPAQANLRNDWIGIGLAGAAILCLIFPLVEGRVHGWPLWCFITMAAFIPLALSFVRWERAQATTGGSSLLPMYLMKTRDYVVGASAIMVFFSSLQGFFLVYAIFLQAGLQFTPLQAGLATMPFPVGVLVATLTAGKFKNLKWKIISGSALLIGAFGALATIVQAASATPSSLDFVSPLFVGGVGAGTCISSLFQAVMRPVPLKDASSGSAAVQVIQQIGGALGVALVSSIFFSGIGAQRGPGEHVQEAFKAAFQHTIVYFIGAYLVVAALALVMKFGLPNHAISPGVPGRTQPADPKVKQPPLAV
ncbi:MFS transporter [Sorangium sp. So ce131]|uniref:MFS transporter n=1 Tax=Sorangium sp. So ce131 TaxID=3133282 RepID=UPI003F5DB8C8